MSWLDPKIRDGYNSRQIVTVTRLFLVRHGATAATQEDRFSGSTSADLSEEGRWQAARLGERLSQQNIAAVYSSPLSRAVDTARIIAGHSRLEPVARDGLREIGHGHWEGLKREDVERQFGAEYAMWDADPFTFAPAGGESGVAVLARALPVIRDIVAAHHGSQVLVVSHKATLRLVLSSPAFRIRACRNGGIGRSCGHLDESQAESWTS